ncbi:HAD family hydrolase [Shewanella sp. YIC-542]|uniref:HAD family hydrolase n=1 Tax=Shewanella mytili TaxID=3377111 RepID=UPI00398EC031
MTQPHINALLFDLDGTLVDTAPDLIAALHEALAEAGLGCMSNDALLRAQASNGSLAMINAAAPQCSASFQEELRQRMLRHYQHINGAKARLFDGLPALLDEARAQGMALGVVTNKPALFTRPLLGKLGLYGQLQSVISADTTCFRKPHPAPMLLAAQQLQQPPSRILYIGDAQRDIVAAKAAGMPSAAALWGYINATDDPIAWQADWLLQQPSHLTAMLASP